MNRTVVISILGEPLRERPGDNTGGVLLDYAIQGIALHSISFWIYLDRSGKVRTVQVSECPLFGETYAIYEARLASTVYEHADFAKLVDTRR